MTYAKLTATLQRGENTREEVARHDAYTAQYRTVHRTVGLQKHTVCFPEHLTERSADRSKSIAESVTADT